MPHGQEQGPETFGRLAELPLPPLQYYELIRGFNNLIQEDLTKKLKEKADRLGTAITLVTVGSDGRREKGSLASPLEIIALVDANLDLAILKQAVIAVLESTPSTKISRIVEMKGPLSTLALYNDDPHRVQPGRVADSHLLYGSPSSLENAKTRLGEEIIALSRKTIIERVEDLEKDARKVIREGRNRIGGSDAIHFDLERGIVYFSPESHQLSFKIGPLRLVQNTLLVEEIKHTRNEKDTHFISRLASGIVKRLDQLSDDRMLNLTKESVKEIADHYAFFLRLYHRSEQTYSQNGNIAMQLEKSETEEVAKRLQVLLTLMGRFKIKKQPPKEAS